MQKDGIPSTRGSNVPWGPVHGPGIQTFVQALYINRISTVLSSDASSLSPARAASLVILPQSILAGGSVTLVCDTFVFYSSWHSLTYTFSDCIINVHCFHLLSS
jgi:hypothetical protein